MAFWDFLKKKIDAPPQCRHNALRNALALGEKYSSYIFGGKDADGHDHCQAVVSIDGKDIWIDNATCTEGRQEVVEGRPYAIREFIKAEWPNIFF
jgi:hypothetical protein